MPQMQKVSEATKAKLSVYMRGKGFDSIKGRRKDGGSHYSKVESGPEIEFKRIVSALKIGKVVQFYIPPENDRRFELDFALVDSKIDFEINGSFHYDKDGKLKPYYKERQEYLENKGWTVINIHYKTVYNQEKVINIVTSSLNGIISDDTVILKYEKKKKPAGKSRNQIDQEKLEWSKRDLAEFKYKRSKLGFYSRLGKRWGITGQAASRYVKKHNL